MAVCIATKDRPAGLRNLLRSLAAVEVPDNTSVLVVIADNSTEGDAVASQAELSVLAGFDVLVLHEPTPGVTAPRNRSVEAALSASATHVAFVDDDECVASDWLIRHLTAHTESVAVTTGPVHPRYAEQDAWIAPTAVHGPETKPDGAELQLCWTNNTVVERKVFEQVTPWFAEEFRFGGEDADFFRRVALAGHRIVWLQGAGVIEDVPRSRTELAWIARRFWWAGRVKAVIERREHGRISVALLRRVLVGVFYVFRGTARSVLALLRGRPMRVLAVRDIAFGLGQSTAAIGGGPRGAVHRGGR